MWYFFSGLIFLVLGYYTYGKLVEKILGPDDRTTPAIRLEDGVDYVPMPKWKNMLIQLLNIAGIGPVIGVILGIKFGAIVFILLPIGNIIGGATHDFIAGMISIRNDGANLPAIIRKNLGTAYYHFFSIFMSLMLLLVVAVFINIPANLFNDMTPGRNLFYPAVVVIFLYYIVATLFPVDKIIGNIYPFFGGLLIVSTFAIFISLVFHVIKDPALLEQSSGFTANMFTRENNHPLIPVLFVTIACGIISGFHATQSPIIARTMRSEREAKGSFYGMMVLEGIIGMIWAGAGMAIYNISPALMADNPSKVLVDITRYFLGGKMGALTVIGVIVLAVSSGDTAMRSLRLSIAENLKIGQTKLRNRILICLPLIAIVIGLLIWGSKDAKSFNILWNYFSWSNQVLAASTLLAGMVYLKVNGKNMLIAAIPAAFMTFIVLCYILWTSKNKGGPLGFDMELDSAYIVSSIWTLIIFVLTYLMAERQKKA